MLTIINLYTIDKIFNEVAEVKLSTTAKMLYINCLTYHFKDKSPSIANAISFAIYKDDIPNFSKFLVNFEELHKAGLVIIDSVSVSFTNCWGKYINREKLENVAPDVYVAGFSFSTALQHKDDLLTSQRLYELVGMKHKISRRQLETLIDLFVTEQETFSKKYSGLPDCIKHFTYWLPNNISKTAHKSVKSGSKLLGEN